MRERNSSRARGKERPAKEEELPQGMRLSRNVSLQQRQTEVLERRERR
jgi:hypothetical protein